MITTTLRGSTFRFETRAGLFSNNEVDSGTKLLIENVPIAPTDIVMDIGCGYGAVGLAMARLASSGFVWMVDVDIRAVKLSIHNAELNAVNNVRVIASDGFEEIPREVTFNVVLSNPSTHQPKATLVGFIESAHEQLRQGGNIFCGRRADHPYDTA